MSEFSTIFKCAAFPVICLVKGIALIAMAFFWLMATTADPDPQARADALLAKRMLIHKH